MVLPSFPFVNLKQQCSFRSEPGDEHVVPYVGRAMVRARARARDKGDSEGEDDCT